SVIGTDRKLGRKRHNLLAGVLRLGFTRVRAVSKKNVSFALSHQGPVNRAARRCARRVGSAGQPQRFPLQRRKRAGPEPIGLAEHLPGVVAGEVCARRGGAEFDARVEHAVENCCRLDGKSRPHQGAQPVAREKHDGTALARCRQRLWVLHIGGGEHLGVRLLSPQSGRCAGCRRHGAKTGSDASAGTAIVVAARMTARRGSIMPPVQWRWGRTNTAPCTLKPAYPFCPSGETSQLMKAWPRSFFT